MNSSCKLSLKSLSSLLAIVCLGVLMSIATTPLWSQATSTGTIAGQVTDPSGASVAAAEVKLVDPARNQSKSTTTNEAGRYVFVNVEPGIYDIVVNKAGFTTAKMQGQKVEVSTALTLNIALQLGSTATTVVVEASAGAELQTMNATVGQTVNFQSLIALPNLGRDASTLVEMQPAVAPNGAVAGSVRDQNSFQLDGANNSNDMDGTMNTYTPSYASNGGPTGVMPTPVESVEEFKVATVGQTADFNASAGGQVTMVTRRGTNQWHGTLYEFYFGTNVGAANNWKNNHVPDPIHHLPFTPLPSAHYNRYGIAGGGPMLPSFWGGKTYIFANYEAFRFTNSTTYERLSPTPLMRLGVIQVQDSNGKYQAYNLNPTPVTYQGVTYQPAVCSNGQLCDPRGLGLNPTINQLWSKFMPLPNDPTAGDQVNTQGYLAPIAIPQKSGLLAVRMDHDFGPKWRFMSTYRYYGFTQLTTNQVDIGGALPGDQFGIPAAQAPRPQKPYSITAGMTTTITPNLTNDFRANYLRNWWQWASASAPPNLPGIGGAIEIGGESATNALIPYNVNTQSVRQRIWDGKDQYYRDDMSLLKGNHLFQFGALYQRNFLFHSRNDNGQGIMTSVVYQIANNAGNLPAAYIPSAVPSNQFGNWTTLFNEALGIVTQPQVVYTRAGDKFNLQPLGTQAFDQSIIPTYNFYFSDTWHMKPTFTLTYGLGYVLELPPYEINGKQIALVDKAGNLIQGDTYLAARLKAAQNGEVFNPDIGFAGVRNVGGGLKYPYDPFYGEFSPRVSAAWNPKFSSGLLGKVFGDGKTVIRGGYSRLYGRLNGVGLVLVPLLGTGLLQAVSCIGATIQGTCPGSSGTDPVNGFRIGKDGNSAPLASAAPTLPQPYYPGQLQNGVLNPLAGDGTVLDPKTKPNRSDQFNFTIQRALSNKLSFEVGYIGRIIRNEFQQIDLDSIDTRLTLGGQTLANAWANLYNAVLAGGAVPSQPFFEAALGGPKSAYCSAAANCAAAVASKLASNIKSGQVYTVFRNLEGQSAWTLGRTLINSPVATQATSIFVNLSDGWANYNAGFVSFTARDFHGITARSNFTYSKALGTGAVTQSTSSFSVVDPYNLSAMYGPQTWDTKYLYNMIMVYEPPFFKGQKGVIGRVLGGWSIAPAFTAQTGFPLEINVGGSGNVDCQTFGEMNCSSGGTNENAAAVSSNTSGASVKYNVTPASGPGVNGNPAVVKGATGLNMFSDPAAIYNEFRRPILGIDVNQNGAGIIRGLPTWNLDLAVHKQIRITERFNAMFLFQFTNVLNHFQPSTPGLNIDSPQTWGVITSQANTPRQMEFGLRIGF